MTTQVCLLRGVNVGGKNALAMKDLAALFESLGYRDVRTLIQSGNVVFSGTQRAAPGQLEAAVSHRFGLEVAVAVRTATELARVVAANPFADREVASLHVGFLAKRPPPRLVATLDADAFEPERFVVQGAEIYLYLPTGMGRTTLPSHLERRLGVRATFRNWNTVRKLAELTSA